MVWLCRPSGQAIWYVVHQKNGVSALGLQRALGLGSYHTAWEWLHKLRRAMVMPGRDRLSGLVEMDETFIGGERSGKRGRGAEGKTLVFIAAEEALSGIGRIRLTTLPDASGKSLPLTHRVAALLKRGGLARIREPSTQSISPIISMNLPSDSTAEPHNPVANFSTDSSNKP